MVKQAYIFLLTMMLAVGCSREITLEVQNLGNSGGAFIECYCQRGGLYNLTATYLAPIDEPQNLDYSYKFTVYITDTARHKISQGIYYQDSYLYSHGSPNRLPEDFEGELFLEVESEYGDVFTASSSVPSDVSIRDAQVVGNRVEVSFETSDSASQNYYALSAIMYVGNSKQDSSTHLVNSSCSKIEQVDLVFDHISDSVDYFNVSLFRLTEQGYAYYYSVLENIEATGSNAINGVPLDGNIIGAQGVFTCYSKDELVVYPR